MHAISASRMEKAILSRSVRDRQRKNIYSRLPRINVVQLLILRLTKVLFLLVIPGASLPMTCREWPLFTVSEKIKKRNICYYRQLYSALYIALICGYMEFICND